MTTDAAGYFGAVVRERPRGQLRRGQGDVADAHRAVGVPRQFRRTTTRGRRRSTSRRLGDRARLHRRPGQGALVQVQRPAGAARPGDAVRAAGRLRPRGVQGHRRGVLRAAHAGQHRRADEAVGRVRAVGVQPERVLAVGVLAVGVQPGRVRAVGVQPERVLAVGVQRRACSRRRCSARACSARACSRRRCSARACSRRRCSARACSRRRCSRRRCSARPNSPRRSRARRRAASSASRPRPAPATSRSSSTRGTTPASFYVRVAGRAGAYSTAGQFSIDVAKDAIELQQRHRHHADRATGGRRPGNYKTVILTDSSKVALDAALDPAAARLRDKLDALAARTEVARRRRRRRRSTAASGALKAQADANAACPYATNLVAEEIKGIVDSYRPNNPLQLRRHRRQRRRDPVLPLPRPEPARPGIGLRAAGRRATRRPRRACAPTTC